METIFLTKSSFWCFKNIFVFVLLGVSVLRTKTIANFASYIEFFSIVWDLELFRRWMTSHALLSMFLFLFSFIATPFPWNTIFRPSNSLPYSFTWMNVWYELWTVQFLPPPLQQDHSSQLESSIVNHPRWFTFLNTVGPSFRRPRPTSTDQFLTFQLSYWTTYRMQSTWQLPNVGKRDTTYDNTSTWHFSIFFGLYQISNQHLCIILPWTVTAILSPSRLSSMVGFPCFRPAKIIAPTLHYPISPLNPPYWVETWGMLLAVIEIPIQALILLFFWSFHNVVPVPLPLPE